MSTVVQRPSPPLAPPSVFAGFLSWGIGVRRWGVGLGGWGWGPLFWKLGWRRCNRRVSGAADHTLRSRPSGEADKKNGDAILIGGGACQGLEGCPGCVSQRSGCQEAGETGGERAWPCLSAVGGRGTTGEVEAPSPSVTPIKALPVCGRSLLGRCHEHPVTPADRQDPCGLMTTEGEH